VSEHTDLQDAISGTRSTVKSLIRTARGCLGVLTDLEERLDALTNAQPHEEAQRDEHPESDAAERRLAVAS
jgi:hypothetical protein